VYVQRAVEDLGVARQHGPMEVVRSRVALAQTGQETAVVAGVSESTIQLDNKNIDCDGEITCRS